MLLDIIKKGAKQLRFAIVEALQGMQSAPESTTPVGAPESPRDSSTVKRVLITSMFCYSCWLSGKKSWPWHFSLVKGIKLWNI